MVRKKLKLIRYTIRFPKDLLRRAKIVAIEEKTSVSGLVRDGLLERLRR